MVKRVFGGEKRQKRIKPTGRQGGEAFFFPFLQLLSTLLCSQNLPPVSSLFPVTYDLLLCFVLIWIDLFLLLIPLSGVQIEIV